MSIKNKAAVSLGKLGGKRNSKAQRDARNENLVAAREERARRRALEKK